MAFRAFVAGLILFLSLFPPADAVVPELGQPRWAELSLEQKQILSPLSHEWDRMEAYRKKKWLDIAKRYPGMKPEEQARVQSQMKDWASLTPDQRMHAREQYKTLQKPLRRRRKPSSRNGSSTRNCRTKRRSAWRKRRAANPPPPKVWPGSRGRRVSFRQPHLSRFRLQTRSRSPRLLSHRRQSRQRPLRPVPILLPKNLFRPRRQRRPTPPPHLPSSSRGGPAGRARRCPQHSPAAALHVV